MKRIYQSLSTPTEHGLLFRWLADEAGAVLCSAEIMHDEHGNAVVIELETPVEHRSMGHARHLLEQIKLRETRAELRVISNENARPYYEKLGFVEIAPNIYQA